MKRFDLAARLVKMTCAHVLKISGGVRFEGGLYRPEGRSFVFTKDGWNAHYSTGDSQSLVMKFDNPNASEVKRVYQNLESLNVPGEYRAIVDRAILGQIEGREFSVDIRLKQNRSGSEEKLFHALYGTV